MKTKIQNIFIYNLSFFSILYIFLFIFYPENSSYFECNEVSKINNLGVVFNIPVSCDLDLYLVGIKDFSTIYTFDYNYQTRPIFILYISIFYNFFSLFISNLDVLGLVAFGIGHIVIATFSIKIFLKTLDILNIKYFDKIYLVVIFFGLSPVLKWGVFDAAHQTLTVLQFTLCFYFLSKKEKSHSEIYFFSFILGLLALANMTFLICLFFLIFEKINAPYKIITNISSLIISCVLVVLPSIFWNQFIIYQGFIPYNAAIEYWKQFIWIKDFILAGYENVNFDLNRAEYYCMSIPLFLKCYLVDFAKTIFYLSPIIYLCILNWLKSRNKNSNKFRQVYGNLLFIYISLFIFWSFIGWYPPLRFNLYGLSYFLLFIYIIQILELTQKVDILFLASIYCLYFLYLNHWNNLNIVSFNLGIGAAILLMVIYSVRVYMESGKPISKF